MDRLDLDSTARLAYFAGLLLLISTGFFAMYRHRMGTALQHAAIWALIFFGAVTAYGLRDEFRAALHGDAVTVLGEDRIALSRGADGHFHAAAEVNGARIGFLVDTGASELVLSRADAEAAGIDAKALVFSIPARTANGLIHSAETRLAELRLGPFADHNVRALVNGGELSTSLLGMGYLRSFGRVTIEGDRMVLER